MLLRFFSLIMILAVVTACPPWNEDVGSATASDTKADPSATTDDSPTTTADPSSKEATSTTSGAETTSDPNGTSTAGSGSSSTSGGSTESTTGQNEPCAQKIFCQDIAECPENPEMPVSNLMLMDYFRPHFLNGGLIPCFPQNGNPDSPEEVGRYLRLFKEPFDLRAQATYCFLDDLSSLFNTLTSNPAQLAVYPGLSDGNMGKGKDGQVLWYDFCATNAARKITQVTITNDLEIDGEADPADSVATVQVKCSVGTLNNLQPSKSVSVKAGVAVIDLPGCYMADGTKGKLEVHVTTSQTAGQFRICATDAEGAMVLGDYECPAYTVQ